MSNGVVHVGAHQGEEISQYLSDGRSPIICFEPQFQSDQAEGISWVNSAVGLWSGSMVLRIPHHIDSPTLDTMSASALPIIPEAAVANGWTVTPVEKSTVPVVRFDEWAKNSGFVDGSCSLLVVDAQGTEMEVLRSFGSFLQGFSELVVECSEPSLWSGQSTASEVIAFLGTQGFEPTTPILRHGDIHFEKRSL